MRGAKGTALRYEVSYGCNGDTAVRTVDEVIDGRGIDDGPWPVLMVENSMAFALDRPGTEGGVPLMSGEMAGESQPTGPPLRAMLGVDPMREVARFRLT